MSVAGWAACRGCGWYRSRGAAARHKQHFGNFGSLMPLLLTPALSTHLWGQSCPAARLLWGWRGREGFPQGFNKGLGWSSRWLFVRHGQCNPRAGSLSILSRALSPQTGPAFTPFGRPQPLCVPAAPPSYPSWHKPSHPRGLSLPWAPPQFTLPRAESGGTLLQRQGKQAPVRTRGEDLLGVLLSFPACVSFREKGFWLSLAAPSTNVLHTSKSY